jgi:hypothetical protein
MSGECDSNTCGYCGKRGHNSDMCRDRLAGRPPTKSRPTANKGHSSLKKNKNTSNKDDGNETSSDIPKHTNKKKVKFEQPKAKVQKVQREEESEDESEDSASEEDEPPRKRSKKGSRRVSNRDDCPIDPWDRKVRSLRKQAATSIYYEEDEPCTFIGILDSGADESCTPHEDILSVITSRYQKNGDEPEVTLRTASGHKLKLEAKGDINATITDVLLSRDLDTTLISAKKMREKGIGLWIPPLSQSKHIGAVLIREDGCIMGVADCNMTWRSTLEALKTLDTTPPSLTSQKSKISIWLAMSEELRDIPMD